MVDKKELCNCGHPRGKHRKSGKCTKCGCKDFSPQPHPNTCRCEVCLWRRVNLCEMRLKGLNDWIANYLGGIFSITPEEVEKVMAERKKKEG